MMPLFLNPWALTGLAAIAIPLAIHLIRLKKREFEVPSLLLFTNFQKPSRKREIENVILMILRCLLIVCLVLLLARPAFRIRGQSTSFRPEDSILVILFDNSVASAVTFDGQRQFDSMKVRVSEFLQSLPPDVKIILCGTVPASAPSAVMSPRDTLRLLESMESFFPVLPDYPGALQKIRKTLEKNADAFRAFALLFACPPLRESIRNLLENAEGQGFPEQAWNVLLPRTDKVPDPYLLSAERIRDERNPGIRVFFTGDHIRLANAVLSVREHGGKERTDRFSIPPEHIPNGFTDIPEARLSVDPRAPLVIAIHAAASAGKDVPGKRASADSSSTSPSTTPLVEYFLAPDNGKEGKTFTLILHDGSPESRSAVLLLHTALMNTESAAGAKGKDGKRLLETFNYTDALSRIRTDSPDQIILPPVSRSNEVLERCLGKAVSEGKTLMLFPQPGLPGFRVPGLGETFQPRSTEPVRFNGLRKVELADIPEIRREFFPLFSKGFSLAAVEEVLPFAQGEMDSILFRAEDRALLSRRPLPNGAELILWAVPFRNPPLSLVMNPLFPQLLEKLLPAGQSLPGAQFHCTDLISPAELFPEKKNGGFLSVFPPGGKKEEELRFIPGGGEIPAFDLSQPGFYRFSSSGNAETTQGKKKKSPERIIAVNCRRTPADGVGREEIARMLNLPALPTEEEWIPTCGALRSAPLMQMEFPEDGREEEEETSALPGGKAEALPDADAPAAAAAKGNDEIKDEKDGNMHFPVGFMALLLASVLGAEMLFAAAAGKSGGGRKGKEEWTA